MVDTSANYMGGHSEILVGEGVDRWRSCGDGQGRALTVVSKFGYASVSMPQLRLLRRTCLNTQHRVTLYKHLLDVSVGSDGCEAHAVTVRFARELLLV